MNQKNIKAISLFSSAGIGEYYLENIDVNIVRANELLSIRSQLYNKIYKCSHNICGDIREKNTKLRILENLDKDIDLAIVSPPCQGISIAGKSRNNLKRLDDPRNYLILHSIEILKKINPSYIIFENVSQFGSMLLPYKDSLVTVNDIISSEFPDYIVESQILDCADYGIPQFRKRNIIKVFKKHLKWPWPEKEKQITVREAIGHLPSLESGEISELLWHFGRKHVDRQVEVMRYTPTGRSAFENTIQYPVDKNGNRVKGYNTTYKRINWDLPAPTITMRNDAISSQANVHPGIYLGNGIFSDARVLSLRELFILMSLPEEPSIPYDTSETLIRQILGEAIPPLLLKKIIEKI